MIKGKEVLKPTRSAIPKLLDVYIKMDGVDCPWYGPPWSSHKPYHENHSHLEVFPSELHGGPFHRQTTPFILIY